MDLQQFLDLYAPLNLVTYDRGNNVLVARDEDDDPFIILVKIRPRMYVALTNYEDPGIASNEFYITESAVEYVLYQDYANLEKVCVKAVNWAVRVKQALRTTDDYFTIIDSLRHPFLRAIYDQYFYDLDTVIIILTQLLVGCSNYPIP
jgi:hypothetical protein